MECSAGQQDTVVKIRTVLPDSGRLTGMDLLVLIVTPSMFDTSASRVWLLYNVRPIARIDIAIGIFGEVSNFSTSVK